MAARTVVVVVVQVVEEEVSAVFGTCMERQYWHQRASDLKSILPGTCTPSPYYITQHLECMLLLVLQAADVALQPSYQPVLHHADLDGSFCCSHVLERHVVPP